MPTLIITNGDSAVAHLTQHGFGSAYLPWEDVLYEGPVLATVSRDALRRLRARYLAEAFQQDEAKVYQRFCDRDATFEVFDEYDEVVLWFEHDLYDQLQLLQALLMLSDRHHATVTLVQQHTYITHSTDEELQRAWDQRTSVSALPLMILKRIWAAFTAPDPSDLATWSSYSHPVLPFVGHAVHRLLQTYPSLKNGLNRTEHAILEAVRGGENTPGALFNRVQAQEEARFMGDWSFWQIVTTLSRSERAPFHVDGDAFRPIHACESMEAFLAQRLTATPESVALIKGDHHALMTLQPDRWIGGVHLRPGNYWCWDQSSGRLIAGNPAETKPY